ncbi:MAG: dihydroorotase [Ignavibacteria bacterium]|nr:dihydroorotase [Ignavibacteria bacterium]
MDIYLKKIRVVNPLQNIDGYFNIIIRDGIIEFLSQDDITEIENLKVIEGEDLVCTPGLFDMHVHFRDPGSTNKEDLLSGIQAAANGGFTGVLCMPNTNPPIDSVPIIEYIINKAKGEVVEVYPSAAITQGLQGKNLTPFISLAKAGALMFTDDGNCVVDSEVMRRAFEYSSNFDFLIGQHCEDKSLTQDFSANEGEMSSKLGLKGYPSVAEEIILFRDISLAKYCGNRRYHAQHISTNGSVKLIRWAKENGLRVTSEVTPQHFSLTEDYLQNYDTNFKMNPPLRTNTDIESIICGLQDGTIDCIASDHAPHTSFEKDVEFEKAPNGAIGLETALGVTLTYLFHQGFLALSQIVEKMSINPRKILNLPLIYFKVGEKANMTIFSLNEEWVVDKQYFKSKSKNTPFEGFKLKGKPKYVINNQKFFVCNL